MSCSKAKIPDRTTCRRRGCCAKVRLRGRSTDGPCRRQSIRGSSRPTGEFWVWPWTGRPHRRGALGPASGRSARSGCEAVEGAAVPLRPTMRSAGLSGSWPSSATLEPMWTATAVAPPRHDDGEDHLQGDGFAVEPKAAYTWPLDGLHRHGRRVRPVGPHPNLTSGTTRRGCQNRIDSPFSDSPLRESQISS